MKQQTLFTSNFNEVKIENKKQRLSIPLIVQQIRYLSVAALKLNIENIKVMQLLT